MKTYIINLQRSPERKEYMQNLLHEMTSLDIEFIEGVDGHQISDADKDKMFDTAKFEKRYYHKCRAGEIGCTLSHQKCYQKIICSDNPYALILEDDIILYQEKYIFDEIIKRLKKEIDTPVPKIILLSGWYWFLKTRPLYNKFKITNVYDALLTHAYIINREAAQLLIERKPFIKADDWRYIKEKGVILQAVRPHLISQKWDDSFTTLVNSPKTNISMPWHKRLKKCQHSTSLKLLRITGHFEKA